MREENERKARELATRTEIPIERARRVVGGHEKLSDIIEELAFAARVDALMTRHGLNRALATQVELGQASLDTILARRRIDEELARSRNRSILDASVGRGEVVLGVHGHRLVRAKIVASEQYEIEYDDAETGVRARLHKLQIKFAYHPDDAKKIRKVMEVDETRRAREVAPVPRPQDRYACSDRRLGLAWHQKVPVTITTLEGDRVHGEIAWISRYEVGLRVKQDREVVIFRHALDLLEESVRTDKK